jgi:hypothetical protein
MALDPTTQGVLTPEAYEPGVRAFSSRMRRVMNCALTGRISEGCWFAGRGLFLHRCGYPVPVWPAFHHDSTAEEPQCEGKHRGEARNAQHRSTRRLP